MAAQAPAKPAKKKTATKKASAKKASAKKKAAKKVAVERPSADDLRTREEELRAVNPMQNYDADSGKFKLDKSKSRIVKGSIRDISTDPKSPHYQKVTIEVVCAYPGCKNKRRIATSDLHQVMFCEEHTLQVRQERRRKARRAVASKTKKVSAKKKSSGTRRSPKKKASKR